MLSEEYPDEIEQLVQSIMDGEISRNELEKVSSLSIVWNAIVRIARSLSLGTVFTSSDQDYSSLPVHVSRFIGAFLSSFEIILEQNTNLIQDLSNVLFEVFADSDSNQHDLIVQLLKDYKDWFPYSYMFNRKIGRSPKSSFDQVNKFLSAHRKAMNRSDSTKSLGSEEETYREEDDDTLGDSFAHDNFPDILTPNILPLKPFSEAPSNNSNLPSNLASSAREYQNAVQKTHSQEERELEEERKLQLLENENPVSSSQEFILKSYYDYSSNWNEQQVVDEDEDSDRDTSYYVPKPAPKRMTRMKSTKRKEKMRKNRKKSDSGDSQLSPDSYQNQNDIFDQTNSKPNAAGKTVSFGADTTLSYDQQNSSLDDIEEITPTNVASVPAFSRPPESKNNENIVEEFEELLDASPQREARADRKGRSSGGGQSLLDSDSSITIPAAPVLSSVNLPQRYSNSIMVTTLRENDVDQYMYSKQQEGSDESSIDLSDSERKRGKNRKPSLASSSWAEGKTTITERAASSRKVDVGRSSESSLPKLRSVLSDDEREESVSNLGRAVVKPVHRPAASSEPRIGDVAPLRRVNDPSRERKSSQKGPSNEQENDESYFRYRNPFDASLEVNKLNTRPSSNPLIRDPTESWKTTSSSYPNFQEILNNDYDNTYRLRESVASSSSAPFSSIPAVRISHSQPRSDKTPLRRSSEFQPADDVRSSNPNNSLEGSVRGSKKVSKETIQKVQEKLKEMRKRKGTSKGETKVDEKQEDEQNMEKDVVNLVPVNRQLLPAYVIKEKAGFFHYKPRHNDLESEDDEIGALNIHLPDREALQGFSDSPLLPVTTPVLKRATSFDLKSSTVMMPVMSSSINDEEYLVERLQKIKHNQQLEQVQYQSSVQLQQSMTIVNLSQSMNEQSYYQQPFQELPVNLTLPPLSEFAQETGVIFESFLLKKSSSLLGQWQRRYFVLKESPIHFCELNIYYNAVESLWGMVPLQLKCSIPIFDISAVETHGKVQAKGKH